MYENDSNADMDPRMEMMLNQMMRGPVRSNVWLMMVSHAVNTVNSENPDDVTKAIDQIATGLTDRYLEMVAKDNEEMERNAAETAPSPFKLNGVEM